MCGNSFGDIFKITTFGESHGEAIGCVIDGCPSMLEINEEYIQKELDRRKPGQSNISTPRNEKDKVKILSGVFEGKTTGTPICLLIENKNQMSNDYDEIANIFRCGHADFTYQMKYGIRDYRGGGRSSARETACRVACGAVAKKYLQKLNIDILAYTNSIYNLKCNLDINKITKEQIEKNITRCPDDKINNKMIEIIEEMAKNGNSVGGSVRCLVKNCPVGLGEPVFDKLSAKLAQAMMSINATKGFEIGEGFKSSEITGEENNDEFFNNENGKIITKTNHCGGILGGISNGQIIDFTTYFKPIATIKKEQHTITKDFKNVDFTISKGRHDPCAVPRAVPVIEAMTAIVLMDFVLKNKRFN